jgi:Ran GTPase-activating protein (RanGAP) involved in mRNA processing and transport
LKQLDLTQSSLEDGESVRAILDGLSFNTSLHELTLTKCGLGRSRSGLDMATWSSCFERNQTLQRLNLSWNYLQKCHDADLLATVLPKCISLRELDLQWNLVSSESYANWCRYLFPFIHTIRLTVLELPDARAAGLLSQAILGDESKLRNLEVGRLWFTDEEQQGMQIVLEALTNVTRNRLESLTLENFGHSPEQVRDLLEGLSRNKCLRSLTLLASNYDPDVCDEALYRLLAVNTTLSDLAIGKNKQFSVGTTRALSEGLRSNRNLKRLHIYQCSQLGDWSSVFESLQQNTSLEILDIQNGPLHGEVMFQDFCRVLPRIGGLKQLLFAGPGDCRVGPTSSADFLRALKVNTSLESINVCLATSHDVDRMKHYLRLNRVGRKMLRHAGNMPLGLWPHVYAKSLSASLSDPSQAYYLMRQGFVSHHPNMD